MSNNGLNGHATGGVTAPPAVQATTTSQELLSDTRHDSSAHVSLRAQLYRKLARVYEEVKYVQKDKRNAFHGYNYASEAAIKAAVHEAFTANGLILLPPRIVEVRDELRVGDKEKQTYLTTIRIVFAIADAETGEILEGETYGRGIDNQDKGLYKAITGALKYWLTTTFLIATGDDPEEDTTQDDTPPPPSRRRNHTAPEDEPPPTGRQTRSRPQAELRAAAGIDTGGHPVGTQAAADHVAQQKIAAAKATLAAATAKAARPWRTLAEAKRIVLALREKVGETAFLAQMAAHRFRTVDDFDPRKPDEVVELYHALMFIADGEVV